MSKQKARETMTALAKQHGRIVVEERPGRPYLITVNPPPPPRSTPLENGMGTPTKNDMGSSPTPPENVSTPLSKTVGHPSRKRDTKETFLNRHTEGDCDEPTPQLIATAPPPIMEFIVQGTEGKMWAAHFSKVGRIPKHLPGNRRVGGDEEGAAMGDRQSAETEDDGRDAEVSGALARTGLKFERALIPAGRQRDGSGIPRQVHSKIPPAKFCDLPACATTGI